MTEAHSPTQPGQSVDTSVVLLVVEDDDGDFKAVKRAFEKARVANPIRRARDGREALAILRGEDGHEPIAGSHLLLVDINMPRMTGIELIAALREDPALCRTLAFILTTSNSDVDRCAAFDLNVAGYILKSRAGEEFLELVDLLDGYWRIVEFPS